MNPFDFYGPQFLLFYAIVFILSGASVYIFWRSTGRPDKVRRPLTDPYQIAYLRGGSKEAVKIAAASLTHRGLAEVDQDTITCKDGRSLFVTSELEKSILEQCASGATLKDLAAGKSGQVAERLYQKKLEDECLLLSATQREKARLIKSVILMSLTGIALVKILIAIQRGRDVEYLIFASVIAVIVHASITLQRTPNGTDALSDLRTLFGRLRKQTGKLTHASQNQQFSFLIAVFGVAALSSTEFAFLPAFQPKRGDNSGCGSSCGGGCSGGCGGGGCGGCGS